MRKIVLTFVIIISQCVLAQIPISSVNNSVRSGDFLCKVKISYVNPGEPGLKKVWDLGQVSDDSKDYYQGILTSGDTVTIFEKGNIRHYSMHSDTLFYKGYQQRRSYLLYDMERPVICYPFAYGDSISASYKATGIEESDSLYVNGWGCSVADGMGILVNGHDTLHHVIRLRMRDDYIKHYANGTDIHILSDLFQWYCAGYRYPIMESLYTSAVENGVTEIPLDSVTYLYLPAMQGSLSEDAANESFRLELGRGNGQESEQSEYGIGSISDISAMLSPDGKGLTISYSLSTISNLTVYASDVVGTVLGSFHYQGKEAGVWQESITLNRRPVANVLMLYISCNGESTSMKVNY